MVLQVVVKGSHHHECHSYNHIVKDKTTVVAQSEVWRRRAAFGASTDVWACMIEPPDSPSAVCTSGRQPAFPAFTARGSLFVVLGIIVVIIVVSFLEVTAKNPSFTHIQTSVTHAENMSFLIPRSGVNWLPSCFPCGHYNLRDMSVQLVPVADGASLGLVLRGIYNYCTHKTNTLPKHGLVRQLRPTPRFAFFQYPLLPSPIFDSIAPARSFIHP